MSDPFEQALQASLKDRREQSLYRERIVTGGAQQVQLTVNGRRYLNFSSNDYLGLANHPAIVQRLQRAVEKYGVGSGAAHLISGHSEAHHCLEDELADYTGRERALLFSTGYMANLAIVNALMERGDCIFQDKLNHASLIDAALLSRSTFKRYPHGDLDVLESQLQENKSRRKLVMSDAVFSMDGDIAPLDGLAAVCARENAWLMIDDAHGFGVLGKSGAGSAEHYQLQQQQLPVYMATLGKAMGVFGAFVAGSETLIETLIQQARPYIYTTAIPPALAEALRESLKISQQESWRREKLQHLIKLFRQGAEQLGLALMASAMPIQPIIIGSSEKALSISQAIQHKGILLTAIRPPTVPKDSARLRITFSAQHSEADIERLLTVLQEVMV